MYRMSDDEDTSMHKSIGNSPSRSGRNSSSPICRLPPELIASIFIRCARDHHHEFHHFARDVPSWVNVSYVCRYWRNVALDCPSLWTYHFMVSLRWTEELLVRSKQASLKVHLELDYGTWWLGPVEKLMNEAERIEELRLDLLDMDACQTLFDLLTSSTPRLKDLTISAPNPFPEEFDVPFPGDTPALRTLYLSKCPLPLHSFRLDSLTILHLGRLPYHTQQTMAKFLTTLSRMQGLTELCLDNSLPGAASFLSSTAFRTFPEFDLPRLARLLMYAPISTVIALLSCVNVPSSALLKLDCFPEDDDSLDDCDLLSSILARRLDACEHQAQPNSTIQSLLIVYGWNNRAKLVFSTRARDCDRLLFQSGFWDDNTLLEITVHWSGSMTTTEECIILKVCCSAPLTNVQSLYVVHPFFSPEFWRTALDHFYNLRYLTISQGNMPDLASVLSVTDPATREDVDDQTRPCALVPALEELKLFGITFLPEGEPHIVGVAIALYNLLGALSSRNMPQGRLIMAGCTMSGVPGSRGRLDMVQSWGSLIQ